MIRSLFENYGKTDVAQDEEVAENKLNEKETLNEASIVSKEKSDN